MPKLIYKDPDTGSQVVVEIDEEMSEVTVGRNPGNIIRINNPSVSRRHTKFVYEQGQVTLYDLNSSNGTYVNGMRIQNQVLEDGDLVRVGEFPLEYVDEPEPVATQVEDGAVVDAAQSAMKSTHLGVGAMGADNSEGRGGGQMAAPTAGAGGGHHHPGGASEESQPEELVLSEDDIEELEPQGDEFDVGGDSSDVSDADQTIEAAVDMAIGGQQESSGTIGAPEEVDDDAQTRRADGEELASQFQGMMGDEGTVASDGNDQIVAELQEQIGQLRDELDEAPDPGELERLEAECDEQRQRARRLESQLDDKDAELADVHDQLAQRDEQIDELESTLGDLQDQLSSRDERIERLQVELQQAESSPAESDGADSAELEAKLREKEQEIEELRQEVASFEEEDQKKKAIFEELSGDLRSLIAEKKELGEELQTVRSERDALLETIDELQDSAGADGGDAGAEQHSDEYQALIEEKESLEETLAEVILERDRLEDQLQQEREAS